MNLGSMGLLGPKDFICLKRAHWVHKFLLGSKGQIVLKRVNLAQKGSLDSEALIEFRRTQQLSPEFTKLRGLLVLIGFKRAHKAQMAILCSKGFNSCPSNN